MKSLNIAVSLALSATLLAPAVLANFMCNARNARDLSTLSAGGGGSSIGPSIGTIASSGCSFLIASGAGTCTTQKRAASIAGRQSSGVSFPCVDRMTCIATEGVLFCVDLVNRDYIDEEGGCGNLDTGVHADNCVAVAGGSATSGSTAAKSSSIVRSPTGTATLAASSGSSSSRVASEANGRMVISGLIGSLAGVIALL